MTDAAASVGCGWCSAPLGRAATLCADCLRVAERDVTALARDYGDLEARLLVGPAALSTRVSGDPDPPAPIDLGIDAMQRAIWFALTAWEPPVREAAGLPPERTAGVRDGWAVAEAVRVIAPRIDLLSTLGPTWGYQDGWDAGPTLRTGLQGIDALCALHGRCRAILGLTRVVRRLPGECSGCGQHTLRRDDGSDTVHCAMCARHWTYDDYLRYVCLLLEAVG